MMAGFASIFFVWFSIHTVVQAQNNAKTVVFTHPEICLPLSSGLTGIAQPVSVLEGPVASLSTVRTSQCQPDSLFRTADGSDNNPNNLGQSLKPLSRFLPPDYADGVESPRNASVTDSSLPLPSARAVSRTVHPDVITSTNLTIFVMQWGQFIDHEMVSTPLPIEDTRGTIQCCGPDASNPLGNESSECFPILFPPGDPDFRGTCMESVRSKPVAGIVPRENENVITSFIDASTVYGSTMEQQEALRNTSTPYLLNMTSDGFPPDNGMDDCVKTDSSQICFLAGDDRVNEQPGLTLMHIIFVRYHNLLAGKLVEKKLKRHLIRRKQLSEKEQADKIFEQVRAFVGAVMQNILFNEWLPIVLGPNVRQRFDLVDVGGNRSTYNASEDPRMFQAFSTAVFRRPLLRELFFRPFEARINLDTLAEGLARSVDDEDRSQRPDQFFVEDVTGHLFENQEGPMRGFDLVALNIQRGRDHGLPSYNRFREAVGLQKLTTFSDPALGTAGADMETVYAHVDDIDLFSGGMSEPVFDGGLVGETFSLLMGEQFRRLKFGDRFFFTHKRRPFGFTDSQLKKLCQITLAHILCLTTELESVQPNVFLVEGPGNKKKSCKTLRHPSMKHFVMYPFE